MSEMIDWIVAAAEETASSGFGRIRDRHLTESQTITKEDREERRGHPNQNAFTTKDTKEHEGNPHPVVEDATRVEQPGVEAWSKLDDLAALQRADSWEEERERRIYRGRTINMLRRYMRYSIETGRLPSLLGREFFRAKVTAYTVVTFEDRVIFAHDMETCLNKLDEFSRQLIARHVLQEHDQAATARLLGCSERTVRTYVPIALDMLSEILLDLGLLERISTKRKKSCQEGENNEIVVSNCETSKNNF